MKEKLTMNLKYLGGVWNSNLPASQLAHEFNLDQTVFLISFYSLEMVTTWTDIVFLLQSCAAHNLLKYVKKGL